MVEEPEQVPDDVEEVAIGARVVPQQIMSKEGDALHHPSIPLRKKERKDSRSPALKRAERPRELTVFARELAIVSPAQDPTVNGGVELIKLPADN